MHDFSLITTIAAALTGAWMLGLLTQWLRLSPIVGYILAGVAIGPYTPGFVGDVHLAQQLAELGVILLMFGVGLHFQLKELLAVKRIAIPGAIVQSTVATLLAVVVFSQLGFPIKSSAVIGMAMAVASTVVLIRVLMDANVLDSPQGHVAVGWLIVEDIFTIVLLVLIPVLGPANGTSTQGQVLSPQTLWGLEIWNTLGVALVKLTALVVIVLFAGSRVVPWLLVQVARLRSRELFTLTILVLSVAVAAGSSLFFGASMALGAFLAGMVVAQSPVSHQAAADALPLRDAFAVLFFVSVGMLFDPTFIWQEPLMVLAALGIILVAKPVAALFIVALLGQSARVALTVAIGLAQIGEFSFILSELAKRHGIMSEAGHNLLVSSAIISLTLNPLLFRLVPTIESWLRTRPGLWAFLNRQAERRAANLNADAAEMVNENATASQGLAVVVGYGPVGRSVHRLLREAGLSTVVIDFNMDTVAALNAEGQIAIFGDASHQSILKQAGVERASHVVLTLPHVSDRAAIVAAVRDLNAHARLFVRARYLGEREELERSGATAAVFEEAEAAVGLARLVLSDAGMNREAAEKKIRDLRLHLVMENMSNIHAQRVRSIMVPWTRVRRLLSSFSRSEVLAQISQERYSRWPVVEPQTGLTIGYLLAKDLIAEAAGEDDWKRLLRKLTAIGPDSDIESALMKMQSESATIYVVQDKERPVGLITFEDILEQVVGRIEDEYPHEAEISLCDAVKAGGVLLELVGNSREQVLRELVEAIPVGILPSETNSAQIAEWALAHESEISTDLGIGVAIPHARCANLRVPLLVVGRSTEGILFSPQPSVPVRLVFLLVTPSERPEDQLSLLGQLARIVSDESARERLLRSASHSEIVDFLCSNTSRVND